MTTPALTANRLRLLRHIERLGHGEIRVVIRGGEPIYCEQPLRRVWYDRDGPETAGKETPQEEGT